MLKKEAEAKKAVGIWKNEDLQLFFLSDFIF